MILNDINMIFVDTKGYYMMYDINMILYDIIWLYMIIHDIKEYYMILYFILCYIEF